MYWGWGPNKTYIFRYVCEVVSRRASFMASAGITALLKKMDYKVGGKME